MINIYITSKSKEKEREKYLHKDKMGRVSWERWLFERWGFERDEVVASWEMRVRMRVWISNEREICSKEVLKLLKWLTSSALTRVHIGPGPTWYVRVTLIMSVQGWREHMLPRRLWTDEISLITFHVGRDTWPKW